MHKHHLHLWAFFICTLGLIWSCGGSGGSNGNSSNIVLIPGDSFDIATETISTSGGTITVSSEEETINGLTVDVPEGAFEETQAFSISCRTIEKSSLPGDAIMLTPLISITNGGTRAADFITIVLPVTAPEDHEAMVFYFDEEDSRLEGMTGVVPESTGTTFLTRHFSNFVAVAVPKKKLSGYIDTGFKPGVDDWKFTNYGSWIAPTGHCAGQTIMAMYYYTEKKLKEGMPNLYGQYDNDGNIYHKTPDLQDDDVLAYKLCSMAQLQCGENVVIDDLEWYDKQHNDLATLNMFAEAMLISGEPQLVAIYRTTSQGKRSGHALIAYKESRRTTSEGKDEGVLHVADPNFPGQEREIVYSFEKGAFEPYESGENANDLGKAYTEIYFKEKRDLMDPDFDGRMLWGKFEDGSIGEDEFPGYTVYLERRTGPSTGDPKERVGEITDDFTVSGLSDRDYFIEVEVDGVDDGDVYLKKYNEDGTANTSSIIRLNPGLNRIGVQVSCWRTVTDSDGESSSKLSYVGFRWVNITFTSEDDVDDDDDTTASTYTCEIVSPLDGDYMLRSDSAFVYKAKIYENGEDITLSYKGATGSDTGRHNFQLMDYDGTWTSLNIFSQRWFYDDGTIGTVETTSWDVDDNRPMEWESEIKFTQHHKMTGEIECECSVDITWCNSRYGTCDE